MSYLATTDRFHVNIYFFICIHACTTGVTWWSCDHKRTQQTPKTNTLLQKTDTAILHIAGQDRTGQKKKLSALWGRRVHDLLGLMEQLTYSVFHQPTSEDGWHRDLGDVDGYFGTGAEREKKQQKNKTKIGSRIGSDEGEKPKTWWWEFGGEEDERAMSLTRGWLAGGGEPCQSRGEAKKKEPWDWSYETVLLPRTHSFPSSPCPTYLPDWIKEPWLTTSDAFDPAAMRGGGCRGRARLGD